MSDTTARLKAIAAVDNELSDTQQYLRDGYHDAWSEAVAEARNHLRFLLAHVETLQQQVDSLVCERDRLREVTHIARPDLQDRLAKAEQQLDTAHAALRKIKQKAVVLYESPVLESIEALADAALAASSQPIENRK